MIKQLLNEAGLAPLAVIGLVTFVVVFVGIVAWTLSRKRSVVETWSSLPLVDGYEPVEPRAGKSFDLPIVGEKKASAGCGKCENCTC